MDQKNMIVQPNSVSVRISVRFIYCFETNWIEKVLLHQPHEKPEILETT